METILILGFIIGFYLLTNLVGTKLKKKKDASGGNAFVGIVFITFLVVIFRVLMSHDGATRDLLAVGIVIGVPVALVLISDYFKKKK